MAANDPKRTFRSITYIPELTGFPSVSSSVVDKGKTSQSWWRKATGPRFLREATDDSPKDSKIAGPPNSSTTGDFEMKKQRISFSARLILLSAMTFFWMGVFAAPPTKTINANVVNTPNVNVVSMPYDNFFQFGNGNRNVFVGEVSDSFDFDGKKIVVTDIMITQGSQEGPLGKIFFSLSEYNASTGSFGGKFYFSFNSQSEHLHFTTGIIIKDRLRIYNYAVSANEIAFTVLGYYLPE